MLIKRIKSFIKKEAMLTVAIVAAIVSMFITPPSAELFSDIDRRTLASLFMLLSVIDGFRNEDLFRPLLNVAGRIKYPVSLSFFLIFDVFFIQLLILIRM